MCVFLKGGALLSMAGGEIANIILLDQFRNHIIHICLRSTKCIKQVFAGRTLLTVIYGYAVLLKVL